MNFKKIDMPIKIEAWETNDGKIYKEEQDAINHELEIHRTYSIEKTFDDKFDEIIIYIKNLPKESEYWNYYKDIDIDDINPSYEQYGWKCDNKDNPIGLCIYDWGNSDEQCVYCGKPEERK